MGTTPTALDSGMKLGDLLKMDMLSIRYVGKLTAPKVAIDTNNAAGNTCPAATYYVMAEPQDISKKAMQLFRMKMGATRQTPIDAEDAGDSDLHIGGICA